ncbi:hypothetical protein PROFUN_02690 [Planoprotostelium fungivorum]|uniref:Homeobox domain-containing protein n=1 Tax=Planoprotostelium fungivorum TaxID=1890364 RepID=A0A2P6NVG7_9EUKA|nr:hypothetical protein PROFUN_02690 [Planoprotostelium fungivorum]
MPHSEISSKPDKGKGARRQMATSSEDRKVLEAAYKGRAFNRCEAEELSRGVDLTPKKIIKWSLNHNVKKEGVRERVYLSEKVIVRLRSHYVEGGYSFPRAAEQRALAEELGITYRQVKNWYDSNKKRNTLPKKEEESNSSSSSSDDGSSDDASDDE